MCSGEAPWIAEDIFGEKGHEWDGILGTERWKVEMDVKSLEIPGNEGNSHKAKHSSTLSNFVTFSIDLINATENPGKTFQ